MIKLSSELTVSYRQVFKCVSILSLWMNLLMLAINSIRHIDLQQLADKEFIAAVQSSWLSYQALNHTQCQKHFINFNITDKEMIWPTIWTMIHSFSKYPEFLTSLMYLHSAKTCQQKHVKQRRIWCLSLIACTLPQGKYHFQMLIT